MKKPLNHGRLSSFFIRTITLLVFGIRLGEITAAPIYTSLPSRISGSSSLTQDPFTSLQFVRALDYDIVTGYKESHIAACTRRGLFPTDNTITLYTVLNNTATTTTTNPVPLYWSNQTIREALYGLPNITIADPIVNGCCSASLWCRKLSDGNYECSTQSLGGTVYTNYGWTIDDDAVPMYTCVNTTKLSIQDVASIVPVVGATQLVYNFEWYPIWRLRIDGIRLSNNGNSNDKSYTQNNAPAVHIGDVQCTDVDVCQNTCNVCTVDSDCGSDKKCMFFSSGSTTGYCLRHCNSDRTCPCGGRCYRVTIDRYGNFIRLCANPGISYAEELCQKFAWGPSILTGMTDRIECTPKLSDTNNRRILGNLESVLSQSQTQQMETLVIASQESSLADKDFVLEAMDASVRNPALLSLFTHPTVPSSEKDSTDELSSSSSSSLSSSSSTSSLSSSSSSSVTVRHRSTQHTSRRSVLSGIPIVDGGTSTGGNRYSVLCAGAGAVGKGFPGLYPIVVERDQGWASTGLGTELANASGIRPVVFNITSPNSSSVSFNMSRVFSTLPYIGYTFPYLYNFYSCVQDFDCPYIDICSIPKCVVGAIPAGRTSGGSCCTYISSGRCNTTDNPLPAGERPTHSLYLALDAQIANLLPLPPPPKGNLNGQILDPLIRNPAIQPRAITWDPAALWYNISSPAGASTFAVSPTTSKPIAYSLNGVSEVDDAPMYPVGLDWTFPFYGGNIRTLYVSGNGMLRVVNTVPCGGSYSYEGCSFVNDYSGIIGPLVSDYFPGSFVASEVWTAIFDASPYFPSGVHPPSASDIFCTVFSEMGLFRTQRLPPSIPPDPSFTFMVCLYGDGGIRWRYGRLLGLPSPADGSWNETTQLPIDGGGPPNTTTWLAGVRSLSAASPNTIDKETERLSKYDTEYATDIAVDSTTELLFSRGAVRPGGNVALCSFSPVACINNACGTVNTSIQVTWGGVGCGIGFESLLSDWVIKIKSLKNTSFPLRTLSPRLECVFGSVRVPVDWSIIRHPTVNNTNLTVLECIAPYIADLYSTNAKQATVPVSLQIVLPVHRDAYSPVNDSAVRTTSIGVSNGIGPSPWSSMSTVDPVTGDILTPLDVYGIVSITYGNVSVASTTVLVPHTLQFTYILDGSNESCGCDASISSSTCDSCSVCGGDGSSRDCAGVCFGTAFIDNCGICSGGTTFHVADSDMDCKGICFGPNKDCAPYNPSSDSLINESSLLLTTVIVIALFTCLFSLFTILAYFGWVAILRQRAVEQMIEHLAMGDATALGLPPGLTNAQRNRMPVIIYDPNDTVFKQNAPGGGETCSICMEDFKEAESIRKLPPCGHVFHIHCVDTWLVRSTVCPVCRAELRSPEEVAANLEQRRQRAQALRNVMTTPGQLQQIQQQQQQQQQQQGSIPQDVNAQYAFHPGVAPSMSGNINFMNPSSSSSTTTTTTITISSNNNESASLPRETIEIEMTPVGNRSVPHNNNNNNNPDSPPTIVTNIRSTSRSRLAGLTPVPPSSQRRRQNNNGTGANTSALAQVFVTSAPPDANGTVVPLNTENNEVPFVTNATYRHNTGITVLPTLPNAYDSPVNATTDASLTIRNVQPASRPTVDRTNRRSAFPAAPTGPNNE